MGYYPFLPPWKWPFKFIVVLPALWRAARCCRMKCLNHHDGDAYVPKCYVAPILSANWLGLAIVLFYLSRVMTLWATELPHPL